MGTLYEEIFEPHELRKCELCVHYDACYEYNHVVEMNPDECGDLYEEEGRTLYDDLFGKEDGRK